MKEYRVGYDPPPREPKDWTDHDWWEWCWWCYVRRRRREEEWA